MHEGTGGAPITGTSFGQIAQENSREAIKILGGLVRNRCRPLGHAHRTMGVQDPLCNAAPTKISGTGALHQGVPKWSSSSQLHSPRLLQSLVSCHQGNRGVEADHRSILPQCFRALPELHYGDASVTTTPHGSSQCCHAGCQPVREYLPKYSSRY